LHGASDLKLQLPKLQAKQPIKHRRHGKTRPATFKANVTRQLSKPDQDLEKLNTLE
jgi:hypothetical protein